MSDIIDRILTGDKSATFEFYSTYSPQIMRFLSKRLPSYEDAQEVMQDVFLDAIDSLSIFKKESSELNWLYAIARNKVVDFYRKKKVKVILLSKIPFLELMSQEIHEPEFQFEKNKIRDKIEQVLSTLSERYRKILILRYEQSMRIKEIALRLNLSTKAAESLLFRARKQFVLAYGRT